MTDRALGAAHAHIGTAARLHTLTGVRVDHTTSDEAARDRLEVRARAA